MAVCPKASEMAADHDLISQPPRGTSHQIGHRISSQHFPLTKTQVSVAGPKPRDIFLERFSCVCRAGGQLPARLREDVGWQRQTDRWPRSPGADSRALSPCQHRRLPLTSAAERVLGVSPSSLSAQESLLIPYTMPGTFYCGTGNDMELLGMGMQLIGTLDFLHDFKL